MSVSECVGGCVGGRVCVNKTKLDTKYKINSSVPRSMWTIQKFYHVAYKYQCLIYAGMALNIQSS